MPLVRTGHRAALTTTPAPPFPTRNTSPSPDGTACDDADACTTGNTCQTGSCDSGTPVACSSPTETCQDSSGCATTCGPAGCQAVGAGVGTPTLTVPAGALNTDVPITIVDLGPDAADPSVLRVYDLGPDGLQFAIPATIDLPAPPPAPGKTTIIEVNSGTGWVAIATTRNGDRVSGPIPHFSLCRARDGAATTAAGLIMVDMVEFQDLDNLATPIPTSECDPEGSFFGVCLRIRNPGPTPVTTALATVFGWQCYNRGFTTDGEVCLPGLRVTCGTAPNVELIPPGGLAPGAEAWVKIKFISGAGSTDLGFCFDGSAFVGIDVAFREPAPPPAAPDPAAIRSARGGPQVEGPPGTFNDYGGIYPLSKPSTIPGTPVQDFLIDARF
jgi:hypothetical protein